MDTGSKELLARLFITDIGDMNFVSASGQFDRQIAHLALGATQIEMGDEI